MRIVNAAADALIVYFGDVISKKTSKRVYYALQALKGSEGVCELTPSYTSLMVTFDPLVHSPSTCKALIETKLDVLQEEGEGGKPRSMVIPVWYDPASGMDLRALAEEKERSMEEIIALHVKPTYQVYAIGFLPGFPYMGTVDEALASPRLANPRDKIPKNSVAIAENQTAIYPQASPAGWRVLGRTPQVMFDAKYEGMSYLRVGDAVQFEPITKAQYLSLGGEL
ncbi:MAG: 5-oxoprolinase subunit PxpB [Marichromatium sp.]|nr:5-oxoprolinase subunit PxpB [Marichromatium sp.]